MRSQDFSRKRRVADQIGRVVGELLLTEVSDPRARGATVSGVELSPDLRNALIYVTLPASSDVRDGMAALEHAAGYLRRLLGRRVRLKYLPRLRFEHDASLDRVDRITELLKHRDPRPS